MISIIEILTVIYTTRSRSQLMPLAAPLRKKLMSEE